MACLERNRLEKMRDATVLEVKILQRLWLIQVTRNPKVFVTSFRTRASYKCSRRDCLFKHEKPRESSKGKPKGSGKGKSSSRGRSLTPGSRSEVRKFWKAGDCHKKKRKKKKKKKMKKKKKQGGGGGGGGEREEETKYFSGLRRFWR